MTAPEQVMTARVEFRWVPNSDLRTANRAVVKLEGGQMYVELPVGETGPRGLQGENKATFEWQGTVANVNALPTTYGNGEIGYGYVAEDTGHAHVWNGNTWFDLGLIRGEKGDPGGAASLEVRNVSDSAPGGFGAVSISGPPGDQVIDFVLPRGEQGDQGVQGVPGIPGALTAAADYDNSIPPAQGQTLIWDQSTQTWKPGLPGRSLIGPFTLNEDAFEATENNISASSKNIAKLTVPAQDVAYRPLVFCSTAAVSGESPNRVDLLVRAGSTSGQVVAKGTGFYGNNTFALTALPNFGQSLTPGSSVGVVDAGVPCDFHAIVIRAQGNEPWAYGPIGAYLSVWAMPVNVG